MITEGLFAPEFQTQPITSLEESALALLSRLCRDFPLGYVPKLVWKSLRVTAGMAYYREGKIGLSKHLITDRQRLEDTLIHEYAHLLAVKRHGQKAAGHGPLWQQAMRDLGQQPTVRHTYPVQRNAKRQQVAYQCQKCGAILTRARKLPRRRHYIHATCGGSLKFAWKRSVTLPDPAS